LQFAWQPMTAMLALGLLGICFFSYILVLGSRRVLQERNFFGVKYVNSNPERLGFTSGNTVHRPPLNDPSQPFMPTLYYSPLSGIGTLLRTYPRAASNGHLRIGIIGMGIASLSAYARPGDYLRFYEIDPQVVDLSIRPNPIFTLLRHSP